MTRKSVSAIYTLNPSFCGGGCRGAADTLIINTEQRSIKDVDQRCRWKIYGAPGYPAPEQGELNRLLQVCTNQEGIRKIIILQDYVKTDGLKKASELIAQEAGEICSTIRARGIQLGMLPAQQGEVKEHLNQCQIKEM